MVHGGRRCPPNWKPKCYPHPCDPIPKPNPPPNPQPNKPNQTVHNIVYLVDEHNITSDPKQKIDRNSTKTLQRRYAWHHQVANLETFNVGEQPDTIILHDKIADVKGNPSFKWEGFMFDIPGDEATCRVGIVAGANEATNESLSGQGGSNKETIDRVVGFAGTYLDPQVPIGPLVQVRRDDSYRQLGATLNKEVKLTWRCAYYITKDTPKHTTTPNQKSGFSGGYGFTTEGGATVDDPPPVEDPPVVIHDKETTEYDQLLDKNVDDEQSGFDAKDSWGGMVFGFLADDLPAGTPDDFDPVAA